MFDELLFARGASNDEGGILMGTVGWEGVDEHFFPGEMDNDGCTLVRVQLYVGRDNTKALNPSRSQGREIVCQLSNDMGVPPKGARCYVAMPKGMMLMPGAGVIFATVGGGNERKRNITAGDATLAPKGDNAGQALIIASAADGSVTLHTTDNNKDNGNSVFFRVSPTAFQFVAPWGRMIFDASGVHWSTKSGARLDMGGISIPGLPSAIAGAFSSYAKLTAATVKCAGGSVYLGQGTYFQPVVSTTPVIANIGPLPGISNTGAGIPNPLLVGTPNVWVSTVSP